MNIQSYNDNELVLSYVSGNENALEVLIYRHKDKIFSYLINNVHNQEVAEDLFQDIFIKVINTLRSGNYKEEGKFIHWLMRIARNMTIDYFRANQRMPIMESNDEFNIFNFLQVLDPSIEDKIILNQTYNEISDLVNELPEPQKEVLKMRFYDNLSFKDIAEITGVSINTALGRMRYALTNLRKSLHEKQSSVFA